MMRRRMSGIGYDMVYKIGIVGTGGIAHAHGKAAQDIDEVVKTSIGRRLSVAGPFELTELTSLAMKQAIMEELLPSLASSREVPAILKEKVERGELGVRSGKGFYEWTPETGEELRQRVAKALIEIGKWDK